MFLNLVTEDELHLRTIYLLSNEYLPRNAIPSRDIVSIIKVFNSLEELNQYVHNDFSGNGFFAKKKPYYKDEGLVVYEVFIHKDNLSNGEINLPFWGKIINLRFSNFEKVNFGILAENFFLNTQDQKKPKSCLKSSDGSRPKLLSMFNNTTRRVRFNVSSHSAHDIDPRDKESSSPSTQKLGTN